MCGRFSQAYTWGEIYAFSQPLTVPAEPARNQQARYNIGPITVSNIIARTPAGRRPAKMALMKPPPELREWIVSKNVNRTGVGDDNPSHNRADRRR